MSDLPNSLRKRAWVTTFSLRTILRTIAKLRISNVKTTGRENVPKRGAAIIAANHISYFDAFYLWGSLRRRSAAIARAEEWKNKFIALIFNLLGMIPIKRGDKESGKIARERANQVLEHGGLLTIFPEGWVSKDGKLHRFYPGAVDFAFEHNCPIVPVALNGSDQVKPVGKGRIRLRKPVQIKYLPQMHPAAYNNPSEMNDALRELIAIHSGQRLASLD